MDNTSKNRAVEIIVGLAVTVIVVCVVDVFFSSLSRCDDVVNGNRVRVHNKDYGQIIKSCGVKRVCDKLNQCKDVGVFRVRMDNGAMMKTFTDLDFVIIKGVVGE